MGEEKISPDNLDFSRAERGSHIAIMKVRSSNEMKDDPQPDPTPRCQPAGQISSTAARGGRGVRFNGLETKKGMKVTRVCVQARSQGVAGENSVTVSQYTPETFSNAREKFAQGIAGGCASQRTRISTWSLRFLPPFSNNPLSRTTIRGVLVAFARGREQESRRGVCWCVCPHGREGETYI